jgi:Caspase domain
MPKNPDHWGIVIGIDAYPQLRPLQAARTDATRFSEWLQSEDGGSLPVSNIKLVLSPSQFPNDPLDAAPVQRDILRGLQGIGVRENRRLGQRLYFYFAGHGVGPAFDDVGMLLADAAMDLLNNNLGLRPYRSFFRTFGLFDEVVFILDCCRDPRGGFITQAPPFTWEPKPLPPRVNDCVILAAPWGEKAFEPTAAASGERRGLLTAALLEALNGKTDAIDPSGKVTSYSVRNYLKKRVPAMAAEKNLQQEPRVEAEEEIVFATFQGASLPKVQTQIIAPSGLLGTLVLKTEDGREIERRPTAQAAAASTIWLVDLQNNTLYEVEHVETGYPVILNPREAKAVPYVFKFPRPPE